MNLENAIKFHSPKSPQFTDSPRATASEALTGTDVMAAMGMAQSRAVMGYSAFLGKMGISQHDANRAIDMLADYALSVCDRVAALRKLDADIKPAVMQTLANYAYLDYCRSAASVKICECCNGGGFIEAEVFSNKSHTPFAAREIMRQSIKWGVEGVKPSEYEVYREIRETVRIICKSCNGKGFVSTACRDCKGRGRVVMKAETERQGVPVMGECKQCGGRGYERIPSTAAYHAVCTITDNISLDTWKKSGKPFYDHLITKLEIEEAWANASLNKVTE